MILPKQLESLKNEKIWICYPMVPKADGHNGQGSFSKPPINPYTLQNGFTNRPESLADYETAVAQIGKTAQLRMKDNEIISCKVHGVGIALGGTGLCGLDLDSVVEITGDGKGNMTTEAHEIIALMNTYAEVSPSGTGLHLLWRGELPKDLRSKIAKCKRDIHKTDLAEYQLFNSGYMTVSGRPVNKNIVRLCDETTKELINKYFVEVSADDGASTTIVTKKNPLVVSTSNIYSFENWLYYCQFLTDSEILINIFKSGRMGAKIEALYNGDMSQCQNDHSKADQTLINYLFSFTDDRATTERLFKASCLYRPTGKSKNYLSRTLDKAEREHERFIGHINLRDFYNKTGRII